MTADQQSAINAQRCPRCETLPPQPQGGRVMLWPPLGHTGVKLQRICAQAGFASTAEAQSDRLEITVPASDVDRFAQELMAALSRQECLDTRALLLDDASEPDLGACRHVRSLFELLGYFRSGLVIAILNEQRLTSHFQPIVALDAARSVHGYEMLLRAADSQGNAVSPGALIETARNANLLFQLDVAARSSALRAAAAQQVEAKVFINFIPTAIYDPVFCLQKTMATLREVGLSPAQLVFEVVESEMINDMPTLLKILKTYRAAGCQVALDDLGSGYASLNLLHQLQPDYVKLDMELVRDVETTPYKAALTAKILEIANSLGCRSIVEGVETRAELSWLQAHGAQLAQGFLLARPAAQPPRPVAF